MISPLLVLNRPGKGRIAMLMSDHIWLWARGFEGGGPHTQLLRRLGHWLMKEPELDEEALRAKAIGNRLVIERQTMGDTPGPSSTHYAGGEKRSNWNLQTEVMACLWPSTRQKPSAFIGPQMEN